MADPHALSRVHLFRNLPEEHLAALAGASERMIFRAGEIIFRQGDAAAWLYVVEEGTVEQNWRSSSSTGSSMSSARWSSSRCQVWVLGVRG
jgi:CRP-like cAMP-binding protein